MRIRLLLWIVIGFSLVLGHAGAAQAQSRVFLENETRVSADNAPGSGVVLLQKLLGTVSFL